MKLEIWHDGTKQSELDLADGEYTVGGGAKDAISLPGALAALAKVWVEGQRLSIESEERLTVGGLQLPARMRRLVIAGERIAVGSYTLVSRTESAAANGTRALALGLLAGEIELEPPASLTCLTGMDAGRVFPLSDQLVEIGRGEGSGVRLRDRAVSRRHARIGREGALFFLETLDSPNGLFVDGSRIRRRAVLEDGALIELGQTLLRFKGSAIRKPVEVAPAADITPAPELEPAPEPIPADVIVAADEETAPAPRTSGEFWLMGLGLLVFVVGILVTASCLSPVTPNVQSASRVQVHASTR